MPNKSKVLITICAYPFAYLSSLKLYHLQSEINSFNYRPDQVDHKYEGCPHFVFSLVCRCCGNNFLAVIERQREIPHREPARAVLPFEAARRLTCSHDARTSRPRLYGRDPLGACPLTSLSSLSPSPLSFHFSHREREKERERESFYNLSYSS
ncbi:hypothetical protein EUGRSUZ_L00164 [Eucalyptus grandis]|uniref:Uncharacterized protein n=1 Tax=Eucalyptus grandis TaxID=71139 RepID=A0A058ZX50_EUCGR|nr:hypothetical protein EUGRSUZ_L00164 [Eucalyptus grandis]